MNKLPAVAGSRWSASAPMYEKLAWDICGNPATAMVDAMVPLKGKRVLDVACGPGQASLRAAQLGAKVTALDYAEGMVERTRANVAKAGLELEASCVADGQALPFGDGEFDVFVSNMGLFLFGDKDQGLREAFRVLKPGGIVAISGWALATPNSMMQPLAEALDPVRPEMAAKWRLDHPWSKPANFEAFFEAAGFKDVHCLAHSRPLVVPPAEFSRFFPDMVDASPVLAETFGAMSDDERRGIYERCHAALVKRSVATGNALLDPSAVLGFARKPK